MKRKWHSPSQQPEYRKKIYNERRQEILDKLGNSCNLCGFNDIRALQIDHIEGNGAKERRNYGGISYLNKILKSINKYQLLCANCNWIKRAETESEQPTGKQVFI